MSRGGLTALLFAIVAGGFFWAGLVYAFLTEVTNRIP